MTLRTFVTTCILVATTFVAAPASADLGHGESKRYVGFTNGLDPCGIPTVDANGLAFGGACFDVTQTGVRVDIDVDDDSQGTAFAQYRVYDAKGRFLTGARFCDETTTPTLHRSAHVISVSVYFDESLDHCADSFGTGISGVVHVRVSGGGDSLLADATTTTTP